MKAARFVVSLLFPLVLLPLNAAAGIVSVENLRQWRAPDHTRLVFDLSAPLEHRLFTLRDPHRVVIDMDSARLTGVFPELDKDDPLLATVRNGRTDAHTLRIVLDLKREARARTFVLKPAGTYGHRLVIDLYDAEQDKDLSRKPPDASPSAKPVKRDVVIAIDAGHGGEDPGAVGRRYRTREKDVTLQVARELARLVDAAPGMKPLLVRNGDYYIGLRERFKKARDEEADVFVSIHADAIPGRRAYGSSVYALSEKGASHAIAKTLADKENAADLIGGVSLSDKDDLLAKVLLDLSHTKIMQDSLSLGQDILKELRHVGPVHINRVAQAGFTVLKAPDIPSVLVETAFISNPSEEKKLRTRAFQRKLAQGILAGVKRYLARRPPVHKPVFMAEGSNVKPREHVVRPGETLASIAQKYDVHVEALRFANNLRSQNLAIGSRLSIP